MPSKPQEDKKQTDELPDFQVTPLEPVDISGVGIVYARVDSGNCGHNVLHGTDIVRMSRNVITFKTVNNAILTKKVVDTIEVHIGGGHVQRRPVIELDIHMRDKIFKKCLFSITDRSKNEQPVLISKPFLEKIGAIIVVQ